MYVPVGYSNSIAMTNQANLGFSSKLFKQFYVSSE